MFQKILIANRGEIACRVIKTARKMGIRTVAVYSEADKRAACRAGRRGGFHRPGSGPRNRTWRWTSIIAACKQTGAEAVHPGYGFLSENEEFSQEAQEQEGIVFIGPKHESIAAMGDKIASKKLARDARVNTIPGYNDPIEMPAHAVEIARKVGYPVMIKASAGGGGRGLHAAWNDKEAAEGFASCRRGQERLRRRPRLHREVCRGAQAHRDPSARRRARQRGLSLGTRVFHPAAAPEDHQEAPSPFLDEATRGAMGEQAVALATAVRYQSAGTVEFVVGKDKSFFFLEMNTPLQVEHPVTELITGLDLVELMIRVATGEARPFAPEQVRREGWAIECRINAEDPFRNFLPSTGRLVRYMPPDQDPGAVRVDTGVFEGDEISMHYDSMIAKLITHGATRDQAIARMHDALNGFVIRGISSNLAFQAALSRHPRFIAGDFNTGFIAPNFPKGFHPSTLLHDDPLLLASVAASRHRYIHRAVRTTGQLKGHEHRVGNEWVVLMQGQRFHLTVNLVNGGCDITYQGKSSYLRTNWKLGEILLRGTWNGTQICVEVERMGLKYRVMHWGTQVDAIVMTGRAANCWRSCRQAAPGSLQVPALTHARAADRDLRQAGPGGSHGENLVVIEAMKMQNILKAENDGVVAEVMAKPGDSLAVDQPIVKFR